MSGEDRTNDTNFAVGAVIIRDDKIFVAKRASHKSTNPDEFEFVGGHVQFGETLEEALMREVREEIGVVVRIIGIVDAFVMDRPGGPKLEVCYICKIVDSSEPTINPDDHSESKWISVEEAKDFVIASDEQNALKKVVNLIEEKK